MHDRTLQPFPREEKVLFEQELVGEINGLLLLFKNHAAFNTNFKMCHKSNTSSTPKMHFEFISRQSNQVKTIPQKA